MDRLSPGSYWHDSTDRNTAFPPLARDVETDIVIIGAGITGLTAAMHLKRAGRAVVVLEAGCIGAGTTGGTSGHLDALPDQGLARLVSDHGEESARLLTQARQGAIDQIENWCRECEIACEFARVPAIALSECAEGAAAIREEGDIARRLGLQVTGIDRSDVPFAVAGGVRYENQARFHSVHYLQGLADCVEGGGCAIYEHTRARPPLNNDQCIVETSGGTVTAQRVLICTHSAFLGVSELDLRVAPYQSYVLTAEIDRDFPDALYWDDATPYHYLRRACVNEPRLVMIGGADHKTGQAGDEANHEDQLEEYAQQRFNVQAIRHRWSAEFLEPADGIPYVGAVPFSDRCFIATGFSGTGLTLGTVAGRLLADLVGGQESQMADLLSPSRFNPVAAGAKLLTENLNVAKHFVADRFGPRAIERLEQIARGSGRLVRHDGKALAVYRDENDNFHLLSPACTHAGCFVQWNDFEKTWDCPCHGGRYSAKGERLYGPPSADLKRLDES